jgi:hypothetical protein
MNADNADFRGLNYPRLSAASAEIRVLFKCIICELFRFRSKRIL